MENVDAILDRNNKPHLERFIIYLNKLGYESSYAVLNAKDYGVPQNRNRCFMISTLHKGRFLFPKGKPSTRTLKDILEDDVPESFYLSNEALEKYERHKQKNKDEGNGGIIVAGDLHLEGRFESACRVYSTEGLAPTLPTGGGGGIIPKIEIVGKIDDSGAVVRVTDEHRVRYLTPRECLRLMGQEDEAIDKLMAAEPAKTTQYKLAGNSIVVDVLEAIFKGIYIDETFTAPKPKQTNLEAWA